MKDLLILLLLPAISLASGPVTYRIEHINLPAEKANELMRSAITGSSDPWITMESWLDDGTAKVFSGAMISTNDATPSRITSAVEWIYPTEFDPPEMPNIVSLDGEVTRYRMPMSTTTPTAFETRDVGTFMEIGHANANDEPFIPDSPINKTSTIALSSELTEHLGNHVVRDRESSEWLADFHRQRIVQTINIEPNLWTLLAASATSDPEVVTTSWLKHIPATEGFKTPVSENIDVDVSYIAEWFTIDAGQAPFWLDGLSADPDNSTSYAALKELVATGHARSISTRFFLSRSGIPVRNDAGYEKIYATEVDPPELPDVVKGNVINGADLATEATPTAFETRNIGPKIEVDTKALGSGDLLECNVYASMTEHDFDHASGSGKSLIHMPLMRQSSIKTITYIKNGKPRLLGAITTPQRIRPEPEVKRSDDPGNPPKYEIGGASRSVLFLTATYDKP